MRTVILLRIATHYEVVEHFSAPPATAPDHKKNRLARSDASMLLGIQPTFRSTGFQVPTCAMLEFLCANRRSSKPN